MTASKLHAMLSPSGASRWLVCAGSVAMTEGEEDEGNEYSDEGTCAHAVAGMCLVESRPASAYVGRRINVAPHRTYEFREDMAEPVQRYVDSVCFYAGLVGVPHDTQPHEAWFEQEVPIDHMTGEEGATGTADAVILTRDGEEIQAHDLKFGMGVRVPAQSNTQLLMYASGAVRKFDLAGSVKRVRVVIHQPRVVEEPSEWDCTIEELREFEAHVKDRAGLAMLAREHKVNWLNKSDTYLTPGEKQCRFCLAKPRCPALAKYVQDALGAGFEEIVEAKVVPSPAAVPGGAVDLERLSLQMKATGLIEQWIKAVRSAVETTLLSGVEMKDWKLVAGREGNREWSSVEQAEATLKSFRLTQDEMYNRTLISPTDASKLAPKYDKEGNIAKKQPKEPTIGHSQWKKLQALITRKPAGKSVAPADDPRPAISVVAPSADGFGEAVEDLA